MSLRRRLIIGILAVAAVLVVTNVVLATRYRSYLLDRLDAQLGGAANRPIADTGLQNGPPPGAPLPTGGLLYQAQLTPDGSVTNLSTTTGSGTPQVTLALVQGHVAVGVRPQAFTVPAATGGGRWRMVAVSTPEGGVRVTALSTKDMEATLSHLRLVQILGTLAALGALAAVSVWVLQLGVRPLEDMATTADSIAAGERGRRVSHVDTRTEVGRLGAAFNAMLTTIEESEERVRQFAADASHELRTPLTSIRGYADLWRAGGFRGEGEVDEAMRRMSMEATRMGVLVEDLLLLARLDQARPLDRVPVRLDQLAADAVADARVVEPDRPITLDVVAATVAGDDARLRQIVGNLLTNARVHTPPGTPVHVTVSVHDHVARLEVADEGPGLDAETATKVFDRFYRADKSRARAQGGSGLGLAIVASVAEAHGGKASVVAAPGEGCAFVVELPSADQVGDEVDRRGDDHGAEHERQERVL